MSLADDGHKTPMTDPPTGSEGSAPYPDALLDFVATPQTVARAREIDAYALGLSAYLWGYSLVRMERVMREYTTVEEAPPPTSYRAPLNRIGWATALATPWAYDMPSANNDTLYMSAVVDLVEPYVLTVPDTDDRYYVVNVFTTYHILEHYIGRRATGTAAGRYALVPPGWAGQVPEDLTRLDVSTPKVWLWGRLRVLVGEDVSVALGLQGGFDLRPMSHLADDDYTAPAAALEPLPDISGDDLGFFTHLGHALTRNPVAERDRGLVGQFARIGLTPAGFDPSSLQSEHLAGLRRAVADGPVVASAAVTSTAERHNGWDWIAISAYGDNYPLRAVHSGPYLGGNMVDEALYPSALVDADGNPLTGAKSYELRFSGSPPVDAFWSLTLYNADDKMLVDNPIDRYKLGSDTPALAVDEDGSFTVLVQHDQPDETDRRNWLPAPKGPFFIVFRFYQPRPELLDGTYPLPAMTPID